MKYDIFNGNPRTLTRFEFFTLRRAARRNRCSYRFGRFYIGSDVRPCDAAGAIVYGPAHKLRCAQWARGQAAAASDAESRNRWIRGAREILSTPCAPVDYWRARFT